jgi:galactose-6-phosphate isomerase
MALISVVELLSDPDFVDPVTVLRETEVVGEDGIAERSLRRISILASVQSNSDRLDILPEATRTSASYDIITAFPLMEATDSTNADLVQWQGMEFIVTSVGRFGNFANGHGHYEGVMELREMRAKADPGYRKAS